MARANLGDDTLDEGFYVGQVQAVVEKMRGMGHVPGEDGTVPVQIMLDGQTLKGSITRTRKGRIFGAQDLTFFSGLDDGNLRVRDAEAFLKCAIEVSATPEGCTTAAVRTIVAFLRRQQPRLEERKEEADKKREKTERKYEKKVHKADNVANGEEAREEESESDDSDDEIEALEAGAGGEGIRGRRRLRERRRRRETTTATRLSLSCLMHPGRHLSFGRQGPPWLGGWRLAVHRMRRLWPRGMLSGKATAF